jgi:hypothetical protein
MSVKAGTRLMLPAGGYLMVTKGTDGVITDGDVELMPQGGEYTNQPVRTAPKTLQLGKRWALVNRTTEVGTDGKEKVIENVVFEALVIFSGGMRETTADLRLDGRELELLQPKVLPSAD